MQARSKERAPLFLVSKKLELLLLAPIGVFKASKITIFFLRKLWPPK